MKKAFKDKNYLKIVIGLVVILYFIFGTNFLEEIDKASSDIKSSFNEINKAGNLEDENDYESTDELKVYYIDVGQADATLIKNGSKYVLIDAGNEEDGEKLVSYLQKLGVEKLNYVFASHPHEDHIGGMDDIIKNISIDKFYMPDAITTSKTFENMLDALDVKSLEYIVPKEGESISFNDVKIEILHSGTTNSDLNDSSIMFRLIYGETTFIFCGDATGNVEKQILDKNLSSTVLKVPHHGSDYSSTDAFINKINPKYAIISVGRDNSYNHPSESVINKLNKKNIKLFRTDIDGTVIVTSDKKNISITTEKTDTNG